MATLPAATILGRVDVSNGTGDENTPSVAINPANPQILASAWVRNDPGRGGGNTVLVEAAFSTNGGASWSSLVRPGIPSDPTVASNPPLIAQITDAGVAFDRFNNLYVLEVQHTASNSAQSSTTPHRHR